MKAKDLLVCIREDNYLIDVLELCNCPKVTEVVEVEKVIKDEDGIWLSLKGYNEDMFDSNCFRKLTLDDVKKLSKESILMND